MTKKKRDPVDVLVEAGVGTAEAARIVKLIRERSRGVDPGIPFSEAEMEAMAVITEGDVEAARISWYASEAVPAEFKRLLDAEEENAGT